MQLDPSFPEKNPYLFENFPKIPLEKPEIPTLVLLQPSSTLTPVPSNYTSLLYHKCNQYNEHPLNRVNHHTSFPMVVPSSIKPFSMSKTTPYTIANTNGSQREFFIDQNPMTVTPNYNEMEAMHDLLNADKGILDLSKQNLFQYGETPQSRVIFSLPPSLVYGNQPEDNDLLNSIKPFSMNQTPSYTTANTNGSHREFFIDQNPMTFTPNYNEMEAMHDLLNANKEILDLSKQNFFQYGKTPQSWVIFSLPPSLVYGNQPEDHDLFNFIKPFSMNQTPSYTTADTNESQREFFIDHNPMTFTPNYNEMEAMHDLLDPDNGILDLSKQNFFQYGDTSQSRIISSLSPSLVYGNQPEDHDQGNILSDQKRQKKVHKDTGIQQKESSIRKGQWTRNEDGILIKLLDYSGLNNWSQIAMFMNGRSGKQCRERWHNHLRPDIKKESWSEEEDRILIEAHKIVGNKFAEIAKRLPGRTENSIKNRWNSAQRSLNATKKPNRRNSWKGTLLHKYINEITNSKDVQKVPKNSTNMMNIEYQTNFDNTNTNPGLSDVPYEISECGINFEGLVTSVEEFGGNMTMMLNGDDGMASDSSTMYQMEFFPHVNDL